MTQSWTAPTSGLGYAWVFQAWTLSVELFFYILFPLILIMSKKSSYSTISVAITIVSCLIIFNGLPTISPQAPNSNNQIINVLLLPILRLPEFYLGILLNILRTKLSATWWTSPVYIYLNVCLILIIVSTTQSPQLLSISTLLFGILILQLSTNQLRILSNPYTVLLGGASYSIYLMQNIMRSYMKLIVNEPYIAIVSPFALIFISILIFRFFETPMRNIALQHLKKS